MLKLSGKIHNFGHSVSTPSADRDPASPPVAAEQDCAERDRRADEALDKLFDVTLGQVEAADQVDCHGREVRPKAVLADGGGDGGVRDVAALAFVRVARCSVISRRIGCSSVT